ncbi:hypothetical protein LWC34_28475 [Kibdelosporangium philippinense]|uniref:Uncharacterized protein n=2 Tax=Kibdelosporangium philippinense TaxID=211113 RepID=A0ABS8ZI30_9PSEU|nr:hypothetical protein [Kibdelosporangium philippinense]MCE7006733.1 hypothetical protein [Kibdelosporangium philippinense]
MPSKAGADLVNWHSGQPPALLLSLDPGDAMVLPPVTGKHKVEVAAFLLALAEKATELAEILDPDGMPAPPEANDEGSSGGRHMLRDEFGDAGGGVL